MEDIQKYLSDGNVENLILKAEETKDYMLYLVVGTHFIQKENNPRKAISYLKKSLGLKAFDPTAYNLGYAYELLFDEENMVQYYLLALDLGNFKSANQLGRYFLSTDKKFRFQNRELSVEDMLNLAADKGIIQAINNLITLYSDSPKKRFQIKMKKYELTKDITCFMDLMLDMLNTGHYYEYTQLVKASPVSLLKSPPGTINSDCPVCLENGSVLKLSCSHPLCLKCLEKIFSVSQARNIKCPLCRDGLVM